MKQEERSERSRRQILDAALNLFSRQGFAATTIRNIAEAAGVSTGSLYHQFPDKETIFQTLLDQYWQAIASPDLPFNRALAAGAFPDDIEALGRATRDTLRQYRRHATLIYVDVVEFEGAHIRRFYSEIANRFEAFLNEGDRRARTEARLRPGVSVLSAVMLVTRFLVTYFSVEIIFGVPNHFGKDTDTVLREISDMLQHGIVRPERAPAPLAEASSVSRAAPGRRADDR